MQQEEFKSILQFHKSDASFPKFTIEELVSQHKNREHLHTLQKEGTNTFQRLKRQYQNWLDKEKHPAIKLFPDQSGQEIFSNNSYKSVGLVCRLNSIAEDSPQKLEKSPLGAIDAGVRCPYQTGNVQGDSISLGFKVSHEVRLRQEKMDSHQSAIDLAVNGMEALKPFANELEASRNHRIKVHAEHIELFRKREEKKSQTESFQQPDPSSSKRRVTSVQTSQKKPRNHLDSSEEEEQCNIQILKKEKELSDAEKRFKEAEYLYHQKHALLSKDMDRSEIKREEEKICRASHKLDVATCDIHIAHFDTTIDPDFNSNNSLMEKGGLGKSTKRVLQRLCHCSIRNRVIKRREFLGGNSLDESECGSTITCSACLKMTRIGAKKVFKCSNPKCRMKLPRDVNATRVMIIKLLTRIAEALQKQLGGMRRSTTGNQTVSPNWPPGTRL